jgi:hypothetical protein
VDLHAIIESACVQLEKSYAQLRLMDMENGRLQRRAFAKSTKGKKKLTSSHPCHMTAAESLDELAKADFKSKLKELFKEAAPRLKEARKAIDEYYKELEQKEKEQERERVRLEKELEWADKRAAEEAEKEWRHNERVQVREEKAAEKAAEAAACKAERQGKAAQKAAEAAAQKAEREEKATEKAMVAAAWKVEKDNTAAERAERGGRSRGRGRGVANGERGRRAQGSPSVLRELLPMPRRQPRPIGRVNVIEEDQGVGEVAAVVEDDLAAVEDVHDEESPDSAGEAIEIPVIKVALGLRRNPQQTGCGN